MAFPFSNKGWKVWLLVQPLQMYDNMSNIYTSQKEKKEKTPKVFVKSWTCMQPSKKISTNIQVIKRLLRIALQSRLKSRRKTTRKMVRCYIPIFIISFINNKTRETQSFDLLCFKYGNLRKEIWCSVHSGKFIEKIIRWIYNPLPNQATKNVLWPPSTTNWDIIL